jgi:hypothetical protein
MPSSLKEHYGISKRGHFYRGQLGHYHIGMTYHFGMSFGLKLENGSRLLSLEMLHRRVEIEKQL